MTAKRIDGKALAATITEEVKKEIAGLGFTPGLAVILVGDDPASQLYVGLKERACRAVGISFEKFLFAADAREKLVLKVIASLNRRKDIDAILVQLPLPAGFDEETIIRAMDPAKDVDGFHPDNLAALKAGRGRIIPGLVAGIMELIRSTGETLRGKRVLVVANSRTFFEPFESVLATEGLSAGFTDAHDPAIKEKTRQADILIVAVGKPEFVSGDMLKAGAVVIDVGTNRINDRVMGDIDARSAELVAGHLTPVPGGVGPMTVAMLLKNTVDLAKQRHATKKNR